MSNVSLNLSTQQTYITKNSVTTAFNNLMGRSYSPLEATQEDTFIYFFFKAVKNNETISKFEQNIRQFHPLNQQAILISALNIAKEKKLNDFVELEKKLNDLEETNKLNLFEEFPKFNQALEKKLYPTVIKVLLASAGIALLGLSAYLWNKSATLEIKLDVSEEDVFNLKCILLKERKIFNDLNYLYLIFNSEDKSLIDKNLIDKILIDSKEMIEKNLKLIDPMKEECKIYDRCTLINSLYHQCIQQKEKIENFEKDKISCHNLQD